MVYFLGMQQLEWQHRTRCHQFQEETSVSYFNTLETLFVGISFVLIVTCRCNTAGSRASFVSSQKALAVVKNITGHSWNRHHLTCHSITIPSALCCKQEVQKCTQTQPSACIYVPYDHWCVCVGVCVYLSVCEGIGGGHLSFLAMIRYSTWYDMMIQAQLRVGMCEKCDDRTSGRLDCDLTSERERNTR